MRSMMDGRLYNAGQVVYDSVNVQYKMADTFKMRTALEDAYETYRFRYGYACDYWSVMYFTKAHNWYNDIPKIFRPLFDESLGLDGSILRMFELDKRILKQAESMNHDNDQCKILNTAMANVPFPEGRQDMIDFMKKKANIPYFHMRNESGSRGGNSLISHSKSIFSTTNGAEPIDICVYDNNVLDALERELKFRPHYKG